MRRPKAGAILPGNEGYQKNRASTQVSRGLCYGMQCFAVKIRAAEVAGFEYDGQAEFAEREAKGDAGLDVTPDAERPKFERAAERAGAGSRPLDKATIQEHIGPGVLQSSR